MSTERFEPLADALLVLEARQGDREAFRQLAERWQARLWRQACRVTQNEDAARDATQEAWLAIVRGLERLEDPARFGSWALSIVTRRCLDDLRRTGRTESLSACEEPADPARSAAETTENDERVEAMRRAIALLAPEQRALVALHHAEDVPLDEIAMHLGIPIGTVKSRLHTAREKLRALLERTSHA